MIRLIGIEVYKLYHNKFIRVLVVGYLVMIIGAISFTSIKVDIGAVKFYLAEQGIFNFPYIWHFNTYMMAILKIFLAIVIIAMVGNEYSYKTLKQNLIDGLSKRDVLNSKFFTALTMAIGSTLFVFLVTLIVGLIYSDYRELAIILSDLEYLLAYAVKLIGFFSFCLLVAIRIRNSIFSLGFVIIWSVVEQIFRGILSWQIRDSAVVTVKEVMQFLPLQSMSNLIAEPFSRFSILRSLAHQSGTTITKDYGVGLIPILIVLGWTCIFYLWSYKILKRRDL